MRGLFLRRSRLWSGGVASQNVSMAFEMVPIGLVRNGRTEATDDDWDRVNSTIHLDLNLVDEAATVGLRSFSHVEVEQGRVDEVIDHDGESGGTVPGGDVHRIVACDAHLFDESRCPVEVRLGCP
jgi:hypothetical protein